MAKKRKRETAAAGAAAGNTDQAAAAAPETTAPETTAVPSGGPDGETDDTVVSLSRELESVTAELESLRDRWLRAVAEQDNLRKRTAREVTDARRFAQADLMRDLLEVMDNFDRAVASLEQPGEAVAEWPEPARRYREGVELIRNHLWEVLAARGLARIEAQPGTEFDPSRHEAVMQVPSEEHPSGTIVEVVQAGYRLGDLVVRPSRVVVAA